MATSLVDAAEKEAWLVSTPANWTFAVVRTKALNAVSALKESASPTEVLVLAVSKLGVGLTLLLHKVKSHLARSVIGW